MNKIEEKFKPCPFCGSKRVYIPRILGLPDGMVRCLECKVLVGLNCVDDTDESEIREKWNRRATE